MSYVLSASRLMKAKEVIRLGKDLRDNAAIVVAIESNAKYRFLTKK